jgi:hypothetical protein
MRGLDPRIHHLRKTLFEKMDGRVKPGHDESHVPGGGAKKQRRVPSGRLQRQ